MTLPNLSRFEMQCLRALWSLRQGTVREVHDSLEDAPTYSTTRKIFERLEEKGAVSRVRLESRAWIYRPTVSRPAMVAKEVKRLLDGLFDGRADSLVAHLADTHELSLQDLQELETRITRQRRGARDRTGTGTGAGAGTAAGTAAGTGTAAGAGTGTGTGARTGTGKRTGLGTAKARTAKASRRSKP